MWPFKSRISVDERIMVWVRGRGAASGADIAFGLGIGSGTLYPALSRLEDRGALTSRWESEEPVIAGKYRRRLYSLPADAALSEGTSHE
jgi:hypothetical protein